MASLLCIPSSNADVERGFSIHRQVHTDKRASLSHSTIVGLMSMRVNNVACCFDAVFSNELLLDVKKQFPSLAK